MDILEYDYYLDSGVHIVKQKVLEKDLVLMSLYFLPDSYKSEFVNE